MLKEMSLENIKVEEDLSKSLLMSGKGKILKVLIEFDEDLDTEVRLRISTKEGEEILNVDSNRIKEIYYPRSNITTLRYNPNSLMEENQTSLDYFYFFGGLLFIIEKDNASSKMVLIKKVVLLYDDLQ